ncbi:MAG: phosphoribosylanthranilate isomerase [Bacteroidota bacterium]
MIVKVCGLREEQNIRQLQQLPIDWMGFIFYADSPRDASEVEELKSLLAESNWQSDIKKVGVFVNIQIHDILHYVHDYQLDFVQLHGSESPEYCRELNTLWSISSMRKAQVIKAFSIADEDDLAEVSNYERHCAYFIFDTKGAAPGGNGTTFDWSILSNYHGITPFLLSGGIGEDDAERIRQLNFPQLHGVDINSQFEKKPGLKDVASIKRFLKEIKA